MSYLSSNCLPKHILFLFHNQINNLMRSNPWPRASHFLILCLFFSLCCKLIIFSYIFGLVTLIVWKYVLVSTISLHFVSVLLRLYICAWVPVLNQTAVWEFCISPFSYQNLQGGSVHLYHTHDSFSSDLWGLFLFQTFWLKDNSVYCIDSDKKKWIISWVSYTQRFWRIG